MEYIFDEKMFIESFDSYEDYRELMIESMIETTEDIFYNRVKYENGDTNILFITGYSGGGKSTMSKAAKGYAREVVDLDRIVLNTYSDDSYYRKMGPFAISFMNGPGKKYRDMPEEQAKLRNMKDSYRREISKALIKFAEVYSNANKRIKLVLEGVWIYRYIEPQDIEQYAVYIKGTSLKISTDRAINRDNSLPDENTGKEKSIFKKVGYKLIKYYKAMGDVLKKRLEKYQDYFGPKYEEQKKKNEKVSQMRKFKNAVKHTAEDIGGVGDDIKRIMKSKKVKTESGDFDMFNDFESVDNSEYSALLQIYEGMYDENIEEDIEVTEGANLEARSIFKTAQHDLGKLFKSANKNLKKKNYEAAFKDIDEATVILQNAKKELAATDNESALSAIIGFVFAGAVLPRVWKMMLISFIPFVGPLASSIITISDTVKGAMVKYNEKKKMNENETFSIDELNMYKNILMAELTKFEKTLNKIKSKLEKEADLYDKALLEKMGKVKTESGNFDMFNDFESVDNSEYSALLLQIYEEMYDEDIEEDIEVTEGANLEARKVFKTAQRSLEKLFKSAKKNLKKKNYEAAFKDIDEATAIIKNAKKELAATDNGSILSAILGYMFAGAVLPRVWKMILITFIPFVGSFASSIITISDSVEGAMEKYNEKKKMNKNETFSIDELNLYKNILMAELTKLEKTLNKIKSKLEKEADLYDKALLEKRKKDKLAKESAEYNEKKMELYEACAEGYITIEEREELLEEFRNEMLFEEASIDVMETNEYLSNTEKFNRVKAVLYEKCNEGEFSIEEREELINVAYNKIFNEAQDQSKQGEELNKATQAEAGNQNKEMNNASQNADKEIQKTADDLIKS